MIINANISNNLTTSLLSTAIQYFQYFDFLLFFRQLRCDRITVHKNLFVSYIITAFCFVIYLSVVSFEDSVLMENPVSVRNFLYTMKIWIHEFHTVRFVSPRINPKHD